MYEDFEEALKAIGYRDENLTKNAEGYYDSNGLNTLFEGWKLCKKFYNVSPSQVRSADTQNVVDASGNPIIDFFKGLMR